MAGRRFAGAPLKCPTVPAAPKITSTRTSRQAHANIGTLLSISRQLGRRWREGIVFRSNATCRHQDLWISHRSHRELPTLFTSFTSTFLLVDCGCVRDSRFGRDIGRTHHATCYSTVATNGYRGTLVSRRTPHAVLEKTGGQDTGSAWLSCARSRPAAHGRVPPITAWSLTWMRTTVMVCRKHVEFPYHLAHCPS